MDKKSLMSNFKVMFVMYILMVLFIIMFLFSFSVEAAEFSKWGQYDSNYIDSFISEPWYTYTDYDSDTIKEFIFEKTNEQYFDNTKTIEDFYSEYTYIVYAYNSTTIRVLVQNNALTLENISIGPISDEIQFFFANMTLKYIDGLYSQYRGGVSAIYSYYIDINYNTKSYSFSGDNPLTDIKFYNLGTGSKYVSNADSSDSSKLNININCLDSFNNNFAWIEYWNQITNNTTLWNQVAGFTPSKTSQYFNSPDLEFPVLDYVSSGVNPVPPDEPETPPEEDDSLIGSLIDKTNEILEGIGGSINNIEDWFKGAWNTEPLENLYEKFIIEDFGEENFFLMIIGFFNDIRSSYHTCEPIIIDLPFVSDNIVLPCMSDIYNDISPTFFIFYQVLTTGFIAFGIIINVYDTISIILDPTTDLWHSHRKQISDAVLVDSKSGEVIS